MRIFAVVVALLLVSSAVAVAGRPAGSRRLACQAGCPAHAAATFTPALLARGPGPVRLTVRVRSGGTAPTQTVTQFGVLVGRPLTTPAEIEPRTPRGAPLRLDAPVPVLDRVVRQAARSGVLHTLLGASRIVLHERGARTALASIVPPRTNITASLPRADDDGPALMRATVLRDLVIDIDPTTRRVNGIQPGPGSQIASWTPVTPAPAGDRDEAPTTHFTATHPARLATLSDTGPAFFPVDGDPVVSATRRDWPVSLIFTGHATVTKVKAGLRRLGLTHRGHIRYLGYRLSQGPLRFDTDRGLKTGCDAAATDVHVRVYAPSATDRFTDPDLGDVVIATTHLDHVDGCGHGPQLFGLSERAEDLVGARLRTLGWTVHPDAYPLDNGEPLRRDTADPTHLWLADGYATQVIVP